VHVSLPPKSRESNDVPRNLSAKKGRRVGQELGGARHIDRSRLAMLLKLALVTWHCKRPPRKNLEICGRPLTPLTKSLQTVCEDFARRRTNTLPQTIVQPSRRGFAGAKADNN
jgi:hypothetical protein